MTALDIIKALPIKDDVKKRIINMYPTMSPAQKLDIDRMAWVTYDTLRKEELEENLGIQYEEVKKGVGKFGDEFYKKAVDKTEQDFKTEFEENVSKHDLDAARAAMEVIVREIQASKKKVKN